MRGRGSPLRRKELPGAARARSGRVAGCACSATGIACPGNPGAPAGELPKGILRLSGRRAGVRRPHVHPQSGDQRQLRGPFGGGGSIWVYPSIPGGTLVSGPNIEIDNDIFGTAAQGAQWTELNSDAPPRHRDLADDGARPRPMASASPWPRGREPSLGESAFAVSWDTTLLMTWSVDAGARLDWQYFELEVTGTGADTLEFASLTPGTYGEGGELDDVSVYALDAGPLCADAPADSGRLCCSGVCDAGTCVCGPSRRGLHDERRLLFWSVCRRPLRLRRRGRTIVARPQIAVRVRRGFVSLRRPHPGLLERRAVLLRFLRQRRLRQRARRRGLFNLRWGLSQPSGRCGLLDDGRRVHHGCRLLRAGRIHPLRQ